MRHKSKTCSLEAKFPLLAVEQACLISKDADITVAFRVELPELFTVTSAEYEAMHSAWHKAIKVLPNFSIVHKQDWFISEEYQGRLSEGELSFLARSSERHFNERPYLKPKDRYPLAKEEFRLYYISQSVDRQTIDVYIEDNFGVMKRLCLYFNSKKDD